MREYSVTVLLAAIITYLITPLVRDIAIKFGAVTAIRARDVHIAPTPRWGGLAMWLAMALTLVIANYLPRVHKSFGQDATGIFLSGSFILFLGLLDDRFDLDPITKFAGQALAAGILLIYGVQILWLPINGITTLPTNIGQLLTVLFVMIVINAESYTFDHIILVERNGEYEFTKAQFAKETDKVLVLKQFAGPVTEFVQIQDITREHHKDGVTVYDIGVEPYDIYFTEAMLSHNK